MDIPIHRIRRENFEGHGQDRFGDRLTFDTPDWECRNLSDGRGMAHASDTHEGVESFLAVPDGSRLIAGLVGDDPETLLELPGGELLSIHDLDSMTRAELRGMGVSRTKAKVDR